MTGNDAVNYIEQYSWSATRLGLERTSTLLHAIGDPQKELRFIHVAGSNGKGSTCAMLESILRHAGYRTGLFTSPHLQDFCERIRVNGRMISLTDLAVVTDRVREKADAMEDHPSQFELVTAIAMEYFKEQRCDIVVLEVGMGGELDATNVIECPEVAVITNIGLDHTEYLGNSLSDIARAKGGIIKKGCTAVLFDSGASPMRVLTDICLERHAAYRISREIDAVSIAHDLDGQSLIVDGKEYRLSLLGKHQLRNAATALHTIEALRSKGWEIGEESVAEGLRSVHWPARFELLRRDPPFVLDGGHNPQCAEALIDCINDYFPGRPITFLFGVLADKDYRGIFQLVSPLSERFICVTPDSPRALQADDLAAFIRENGYPATACSSIEDGIRQALLSSGCVVAFGSLYLAGHVRAVFPSLLNEHTESAPINT